MTSFTQANLRRNPYLARFDAEVKSEDFCVASTLVASVGFFFEPLLTSSTKVHTRRGLGHLEGLA